jgi:uncharacterized protein (TIGR02646 family)
LRPFPIPPCPPILAPTESRGAEERAEAIAHFTSPDWQSKATFKFSAYQHEEVRETLFEAFQGVCAYCEAPVPSIEVEHYRPKGAVQTETEKRSPGYYWLASSWENLLPSCHQCNTDLWTAHPDGKRRKSGKGIRFPLEDESKRATKAGEERHERPLLLHPYHDHPAEHLEFVEEGVVRARVGADGTPSVRGEATIALLGLDRRGLADARRDRHLIVQVTLKALREAQRRHREDPDDEEAAAEHQQRIAELGQLLAPKAGFSGMAAQCAGLT